MTNLVYMYLLRGEHFKGNEIKRTKVCEDIGITEREFRKLTAHIQEQRWQFKVNFNSKGVYLVGIMEIEKLRNRAIRSIEREMKKIKEFDRILDCEGQVKITENLELVVERYGVQDE